MDFLLQDKGDGGAFLLTGGDIKQDNTFYTAVYLSLFNGDCFYNVYTEYKTNEEFEKALNLSVTAQNLKAVETAAQNALKWMLSEEIISSIDVRAYGDKEEKINVAITFTEPDGITSKYSITWQNQKAVLNTL